MSSWTTTLFSRHISPRCLIQKFGAMLLCISLSNINLSFQNYAAHYNDEALGVPIGLLNHEGVLKMLYADNVNVSEICSTSGMASQIMVLEFSKTHKWEIEPKQLLTAKDVDATAIEEGAIFYNADKLSMLELLLSKDLLSVNLQLIFTDPMKLQEGSDYSQQYWLYPSSYLYSTERSLFSMQVQPKNEGTKIIYKEQKHVDAKLFEYIPSCYDFYPDIWAKTSATSLCTSLSECIQVLYLSKINPESSVTTTSYPGLYYKIVSLDTKISFACNTTAQSPENDTLWRQLDAGSALTKFVMSSLGNEVVGFGYGSAYDCRRILTLARKIELNEKQLIQTPIVPGKRRLVQVNNKTPLSIPTKSMSASGCSGLIQQLPKINSSEYYILRYTFAPSIVGKEISWTMKLYSTKNMDKKISIKFNTPDLKSTPTDRNIYYAIDRTSIMSSGYKNAVSKGVMNLSGSSITGKVLIVVDNGILEVFFENGAHVITETYEVPSEEFDQICSLSGSEDQVILVQEEIWVYSIKEKSERADINDNVTRHTDVYDKVIANSATISISSALATLASIITFYFFLF